MSARQGGEGRSSNSSSNISWFYQEPLSVTAAVAASGGGGAAAAAAAAVAAAGGGPGLGELAVFDFPSDHHHPLSLHGLRTTNYWRQQPSFCIEHDLSDEGDSAGRMDLLENQVSDLKYLTQNAITPLADTPGAAFTPQSAVASPVSAVGHNSAHQQHQQQHQHQQHLHQQQHLGQAAHQHHAAQGPPSATGLEYNPSVTGSSSSSKRKHLEDNSPAGKGQRSKRNRYIAIACNECKRRKIKCNGETPCQRCGNLNLQCLYAPNCCSNNVKDSEEFKDMAGNVAHLQEQVETLFNNLNQLRSETLRLAPIQPQDRVAPLPSATSAGTPSSSASMPPGHRSDVAHLRDPGFRGPTSTRFSLDVAKNTLHQMGYSHPGDENPDEGVAVQQETPTTSPMLPPLITEPQPRSSPDPLWEFDKDEMIRLCRVYEEEVGIMYPVIRVETVVNHARILASWMEAAKKNFLVPPTAQDNGISDHKTLILKLVMCNALIVEEHGDSDRGIRLFESCRATLDRILMSDAADVANLPLLALLAGYRFLANEEVLAWRVIGQAARHCVELGLHRRDAIMKIQDDEERRNAIHTFWTAYVLDRRWSFGTGLPYVLHDEEIDPSLPYPDQHPFLVAMISYSQISAKVWRLVRHYEPNIAMNLRQADIEDLDTQIKAWYTDVPPEVQLELPGWDDMPRHLQPPTHSQKEYNIQRLQIWTYLRLNQIRTWLYMPILHTHSSIMENLPLAERAVKLAKNTIQYLTRLNSTTNVYRKMQVFYHQFLTSAIAVLFLASCHAPVNFSATCRNEFYIALELVRDLSSKSWVSKRLWRTIKSLKEVAPRLGLAEAEDPHSTAALTMAGLATGQHVDPSARTSATPPASTALVARPVAATVSGGDTPSTQDQNGWQISTEMSRIFEGYMGINGLPTASTEELSGTAAAHHVGGGPPPEPFGIQTPATRPPRRSNSVYSHFRDMF